MLVAPVRVLASGRRKLRLAYLQNVLVGTLTRHTPNQRFNSLLRQFVDVFPVLTGPI